MKRFYISRAKPGITFKFSGSTRRYGWLIKDGHCDGQRNFPVELDYLNYTFIKYYPEVDMAEIYCSNEQRTYLVGGSILIEA